MRLTKIDGELNGHKFSVKSTTPKAIKIEEELQEEVKAWHEKNNKEFLEFTKKYKDELTSENLDALPDEIPEHKNWLLDEDFRASRYKKMALASMDFKKQPSESLWKSDELETSTIEEAFEYFLGKRKVPTKNTYAR